LPVNPPASYGIASALAFIGKPEPWEAGPDCGGLTGGWL
jgi:hypothetical protein